MAIVRCEVVNESLTRYLHVMKIEQASPSLHLIIQDAAKMAAGNLDELAAEVRVTYASLKAWIDGRRNPTPEHLRRLADVLDRRGSELRRLADELKIEAGKGRASQ